MTSLLEKTLSVIAPHRCIKCSNYNNILCSTCVNEVAGIEPPACVLCGVYSDNWQICATCTSTTKLTGVWVAGDYEAELKALIHAYKFDHARAACQPLAQCIVNALPHLDKTWLVTTVPTISQHVRQRGYDHARLLAQEVARKTKLDFKETLLRKQNVQQRGAARAERFQQTSQAFALQPRASLTGKNVLIVDDVCTTGATMTAAAAVLQGAGVRQIWGAVAAWRRKDERKMVDVTPDALKQRESAKSPLRETKKT